MPRSRHFPERTSQRWALEPVYTTGLLGVHFKHDISPQDRNLEIPLSGISVTASTQHLHASRFLGGLLVQQCADCIFHHSNIECRIVTRSTGTFVKNANDMDFSHVLNAGG